VFALGNAVTGRGNIKDSFHHGRMVAEWVMDNFLNWRIEDFQKFCENPYQKRHENETGPKILSEEQIRNIIKRVKDRQQKVDYNGNYLEWVEKHRPVRLENMNANPEKQNDTNLSL
jgi:hypothetical protein